MEEIFIGNFEFVRDIYREIYRKVVENIKDNTIKVVEFYIDKEQFYVDKENNVYKYSSKNESKLFGRRVGYLRDGTIYIGSINQYNT